MRSAALLLSISLTTGSLVGETIPLDASKMKLVNVKTEQVTHKGRSAVRVTAAGNAETGDGRTFAILHGTDFQDGVIEVDLAGDRVSGAPETARGFTGIAFRVTADGSRYECFYLRPYNGRSEDQLQRNHAAQYVAEPDFGWKKLRDAFPAKYETYVDLVPGDWNKVKIEVRGDKARLYVNGAPQPTLIVNDMKYGASKGAIALWVGPWTIAHFANLQVSK